MTDATPPLWLPVLEWSGYYEVSHRGWVRSVDRTIIRKDGRSAFIRGRVLALSPLKAGHLTVWLHRNGESRQRLVHHLVLEAFDRPRPPGLECRHGPGGPSDNRWPENICWGTKADNQGPDKERDGTLLRGERHGGAKLTDALVRECRERQAHGATIALLSQETGLSQMAIWRAVVGITWSHVPSPNKPQGHRGEQHEQAKLTVAIVRECRQRASAGETQAALALEFGVARATMADAIRGRTWAHIR